MRTSIRVTLAVLATVLLAAGCRRADSGGPGTIRVGYLPIASDLSFFVALQERTFDTALVRVEPVRFETSNQAIEALIAGRIDATAVVALEATLAAELAAPGVLRFTEITVADSATSVHRIVALPGSGITGLGGLRGKVVGTFPGSQMTTFLRMIVERTFDPAEMTIIQLRPPLQAQALASGQVAALFCLEPVCTQVAHQFGALTVVDNPLVQFIQRPFPTAVGLVRLDFQRSQGDVVDAFIRGLEEAHRLIRTGGDRIRLAVVPFAPVDTAVALAMGLYDYGFADTVMLGPVQRLTDLYSQEGILSGPVNVSPLMLPRR